MHQPKLDSHRHRADKTIKCTANYGQANFAFHFTQISSPRPAVHLAQATQACSSAFPCSAVLPWEYSKLDPFHVQLKGDTLNAPLLGMLTKKLQHTCPR